MKKQFWVTSLNANKSIVTASIEAGADAIYTNKGNNSKIKEMGIIKTICEDGDIVPNKDVKEVTITSKEKEKEVERVQGKVPVIIKNI